MTSRLIIMPDAPLHERLAIFAKYMRNKAACAEPGPERDDLLMRAQQADTALRDGWAYAAGLQPHK
jgi:hypothetical protein